MIKAAYKDHHKVHISTLSDSIEISESSML